jgi:hypothetical protein
VLVGRGKLAGAETPLDLGLGFVEPPQDVVIGLGGTHQVRENLCAGDEEL